MPYKIENDKVVKVLSSIEKLVDKVLSSIEKLKEENETLKMKIKILENTINENNRELCKLRRSQI
jgi:predicted  nucleic acid-binding Zn-ribbon protein